MLARRGRNDNKHPARLRWRRAWVRCTEPPYARPGAKPVATHTTPDAHNNKVAKTQENDKAAATAACAAPHRGRRGHWHTQRPRTNIANQIERVSARGWRRRPAKERRPRRVQENAWGQQIMDMEPTQCLQSQHIMTTMQTRRNGANGGCHKHRKNASWTLPLVARATDCGRSLVDEGVLETSGPSHCGRNAAQPSSRTRNLWDWKHKQAPVFSPT